MAKIYVHPSPDGDGFVVSLQMFQGALTRMGEGFASAEQAYAMVGEMKNQMAFASVDVLDRQPEDSIVTTGPTLFPGHVGSREFVGGLSRYAQGGAVTVLPRDERVHAYGSGQPANRAGNDGGYYEETPESAIDHRGGSTSLLGQEVGVPKASKEEVAAATDARLDRLGMKVAVTRTSDDVRPIGGATKDSRPNVDNEGDGTVVQRTIDPTKAGAARIDQPGAEGADTVTGAAEGSDTGSDGTSGDQGGGSSVDQGTTTVEGGGGDDTGEGGENRPAGIKPRPTPKKTTT